MDPWVPISLIKRSSFQLVIWTSHFDNKGQMHIYTNVDTSWFQPGRKVVKLKESSQVGGKSKWCVKQVVNPPIGWLNGDFGTTFPQRRIIKKIGVNKPTEDISLCLRVFNQDAMTALPLSVYVLGQNATVDGRNPANQLRFTRFYTSQVLSQISSINSIMQHV